MPPLTMRPGSRESRSPSRAPLVRFDGVQRELTASVPELHGAVVGARYELMLVARAPAHGDDHALSSRGRWGRSRFRWVFQYGSFFGFWFSSFGFPSLASGVDSAVRSRASGEKIRVIVLSPTSLPTRETNVVSSPTPAAAPKTSKTKGDEKKKPNSKKAETNRANRYVPCGTSRRWSPPSSPRPSGPTCARPYPRRRNTPRARRPPRTPSP